MDISVRIMARPRMDSVPFPVGTFFFCVIMSLATVTFQPASCPVGTGRYFLGVKTATLANWTYIQGRI